MTHNSTPDFTSTEFLNAHIKSILDFYQPTVFDPSGGFYQTFRDDGTVYDADLRHLVSSTRFVFNYAHAYRHYANEQHLAWVRHGLKFLQDRHLQAEGHFAWELRGSTVSDKRAMAYGHAFVMLAGASAVQAGVDEASNLIESSWELLERLFWLPEHNTYADERDGSLAELNDYRGQNANMHSCEALLAAWEATGEERYLDRAALLAKRFAVELAALSDGLIWEHYDSHWQVDMQYNIDKPDDLFKPWGFQPGHQVEWSKLLLQLYSHRPEPWMLERASALFTMALERGWDNTHGGLVYGFAPDGSFCDANKYFWVQAEAFAAAMRLYNVTGEQRFLSDYKRIWEWSWQYLVDHEQGAWFRIRNRDGSSIDDLKSPPGKTDYHTMGACWDVLANLPDHLADKKNA